MADIEEEASLASAGCGPALQGSYVADGEFAAAGDAHLYESRMFLFTLVAVTSLGPLSTSSFIPALPMIQGDFEISGSVSQLTISVAMLCMAAASMFYGDLADRYGRRPVLLGGVMLAFVGSLVCALAPGIVGVIAGRAIQAVGATAGFVLARVIVTDVYGEKRAGSVLGYVTAAMTLAPMLGPLLGGYLAQYVHWRAIFVAIAGVSAALGFTLYRLLPETRPSMVERDGALIPWRRFGALLKRPDYRGMVVYGAAMQGAFMAFIAAAPFIVTHVYSLPVSAYGWYFIVVPAGYFLGSMIAGRFAERLGNERLVLLGVIGAVLSASVALLIALISDFGPWGFFLPTALLAVAQGAALPGSQVLMLQAANPHRGSGSGLFSSLQLMSSACVVQCVALVIGHGAAGVTSLMLICVVIAWLSLLPGRRATPEMHRSSVVTK
ncbi:MAG: multidrug effflux MFS transporter [Congregibacter sp.]